MTVAPAQAERRIHDLFAEQAALRPAAVAVQAGPQALTYAELDRRSAVLAAHLRSLGVEREVPVGVFLERSADMVVALLAILKAGGAYVPLDPDFPPERLAYMVEDARVPVVVTQTALRGEPPTPARAVEIDGGPEGPVTDTDSPLDTGGERGAAPSSAAYIMYTSGSTGRPKGVVVEHRNAVNFLLSMREEPGIDGDDVLVAVTTLSFDISILELFLPLTAGGRCVVADRDTTTSGEQLAALLASSGATMMQATPATWRLLLEAGWTGSPAFKVLVGGEALPGDLARGLFARAGSVWNMYGPTETTVWSTCYRLPSADAPVLIGRPIANTQVYVLNKGRQPVPVGVPGELFIGGLGVARGYLRREELTLERFPADPLAARPGARMYRTGDVGRYLADGNLEFRQRVDDQVKVRGFRIELGEIEAALSGQPGIRQAAAAVVQPKPGDVRLVAYLVLEEGRELLPHALREELRRSLPHYMVPQHFVPLDRLPLTPNGKVDRAQLPAFGAGDPSLEAACLAPRTPTERTVASVWAEVMGLERVGADANFFDLGGHSVLAIRVVSRLKQECGVPLTLRHLFLAPTVEELARQVDTLRAEAESVGVASDEERLVF